MNRPGDPEAIQLVKEMIRDEAAGFYLLQLPNGKWGALWCQALDGEWAESISVSDYSEGCAHVGEAYAVAEYIKDEYQSQMTRDPLNPPKPINPSGLIARILRTFPAQEDGVDSDTLLAEITPENIHPEIDFGPQSTQQLLEGGVVAIDHVTPANANIFADLGLTDAESLRVKAVLMVEITRIWRESGLDQDKMAKRLGATPARFSDIVNGRIGECSIEWMIDMLSAIDKHVTLTIGDVKCS